MLLLIFRNTVYYSAVRSLRRFCLSQFKTKWLRRMTLSILISGLNLFLKKGTRVGYSSSRAVWWNFGCSFLFVIVVYEMTVLTTVKHWNNNKFIKIEVSKHCCINCHIIFRLNYKCFCSHLLLYFAQWYKHHLVQCMLYGQYVDSIFNRVFALYQRFMCFPYILLANSTSACHRFLQMHSI